MKNHASTIVMLSCILLSSCVSQLKINKAEKEEQYWIVPRLNTEAVSYIGDTLLREGTSTASDSIVLKDNHGTLGVTAYFEKGTYKYIGTGTKTIRTAEGQNKQETKIFKVYQYGSVMPGMVSPTYAQLLEDEDGNVFFNSTTESKPLGKSEYTKKTVVDDSDLYFEQQLIYTGGEGKILKFTYREFVDGTARPAFTIDATYDMNQENIIRFKGAELEILSYNNQSIQYKILSGFKTK